VRFGLGMMGDTPLRAIARRAKLLEQLDYDQLWMADERLMRNLYSCLTVAALETAQIGVGTAVTNPYTRSPALTAAAIATIDEASGGRAVLGLGAGGGIGQYGIDRSRPAIALRETVEIVRRLTAGERVSFEGKVFSMSEIELNFVPLRAIPIYLAARGPRILELAGEIADGVIIGGFALRSGLEFARSCIQTGLSNSGRSWTDLEVVSWLYTSVDDNPETAREAVSWLVFTSLITSRPILDQIGIAIPAALRDHLDRTGWSLTPDSIAVGKTLLNAEMLDAFSVTGTPSQCAGKLRDIAQLGVDQIAMVPLCPNGVSFETMARRIATDVLPLVTHGSGI